MLIATYSNINTVRSCVVIKGGAIDSFSSASMISGHLRIKQTAYGGPTNHPNGAQRKIVLNKRNHKNRESLIDKCSPTEQLTNSGPQ